MYTIFLRAVDIRPSGEFVAVVNDTAIFRCLSNSHLDSVRWIVNGTLFEDGSLRNVNQSFSRTFGIGQLTFSNLPQHYNNTDIGCKATDSSGMTLFSRHATLLLVQGKTTQVDMVDFMP